MSPRSFFYAWLLLLGGLYAALPAAAQHRTVAVVYDDSGSMLSGNEAVGRRWVYANYALQMLTGMLAEEDQLFVVQMSTAAQADAMMLTQQAAAIDSMRQLPMPVDGSPTPYGSVATAMQALEASGGTDNWMLIITDGEFNDAPPVDFIQPRVRTFMERTGARVLFLLIGENDAEVQGFADQPAVAVWREEAQASIYRALGPQDIIAQMQRIAADITARTFGQGPRIDVQGDRVRVETELPLRRLTLLQQDPQPEPLVGFSSASVDGQGLRAPSVLDAAFPEPSILDLYGRLTHLSRTAEGRTIPAGIIDVRLDRNVATNELDVLPEVAARLAVRFVDAEGIPIAVQGGLVEPCRGSSFRIEAALLSPEGDTLTQQIQRPNDLDVRLRLSAQEQAMTLHPSRTRFERLLAVPDSATTASVSAVYPGYFNYLSSVYTVRGVYCAPPRALDLSPPPSWEADLDKVPDTAPLTLTPTADGQPVTPPDFEQWSLDVVDDDGLNLNMERSDNGWTLKPRRSRPLWQLTPTGPFEVTVEARTQDERETPARQTLTFTIHDIGFWAKWGLLLMCALVLLVLLWYLIGIIRKPRFAAGSGINHQRVQRSGVTRRQPSWYPLPTAWANRWLVPYLPESRRVEGMRFVAAPKSYFVKLPIGELNEDMFISGLPIIEDPENPPKRDPTLQNNETLRIKTGRSEERYTYLTAQQGF